MSVRIVHENPIDGFIRIGGGEFSQLPFNEIVDQVKENEPIFGELLPVLRELVESGNPEVDHILRRFNFTIDTQDVKFNVPQETPTVQGEDNVKVSTMALDLLNRIRSGGWKPLP